MKAILLILSLLILNSSLLLAGNSFKRPFDEFGYPKSTISYGQKNGIVFFFKDDPLRDYENSGFYLELLVSPLIDKAKSQLAIKLGDIPVQTLSLQADTDTIKVYIPLLKNISQSGFIKLSIEPNLWFPIDDCMDIDQKNIWVKVSENSYFEEKTLGPSTELSKWSIARFLPSSQQILIAKKDFNNYAGALAHLHYFFLQTQGKSLPLKFLEETSANDFHHAVIVGEVSTLQSELSKRFQASEKFQGTGAQIMSFEYLDSINNQTVYLNNLILSSDKASDLENLVRQLFTQVGESSLLNSSIQLIESPRHEPRYLFDVKNRYSLQSLGMNEEVIAGKGRIRKNLSLPEFLAKPSLNTISFDISATYKPVRGNEKAYLNIFINNRLLQTYQLDGSGFIEKRIESRKAQFGAGNFIGFEFIYIPEGGMCNENAADFYAQIDPNQSAIGFQYHSIKAKNFHSFPSNFSGREVQIIHDYALSLDDIPSFSKIIGLLNLRDTESLGIYLPKILSLNTAPETFNTHTVLVSRSDNNFEKQLDGAPFLIFDQQKISYRSDELDKFFSYRKDNALNYAQIFEHKGLMVLKLNLLSANHLAFDKLLEGFREQVLTNTGNVMIADHEQYFFFNLSQTDLKNEKRENKAKFESFWYAYRIIIISMLIAIVIVLLIYIYKKSRFAQKSIEDARK